VTPSFQEILFELKVYPKGTRFWVMTRQNFGLVKGQKRAQNPEMGAPHYDAFANSSSTARPPIDATRVRRRIRDARDDARPRPRARRRVEFIIQFRRVFDRDRIQ